jgi:hypothetical protein
MRTLPLVFTTLAVGVAVPVVAVPSVASSASAKQCGTITDPKNSSRHIKVDYVSKISCSTARRVLRAFLSRLPRPFDGPSSSITVRSSGKKWGCYLVRTYQPKPDSKADFACGANDAGYKTFYGIGARII